MKFEREDVGWYEQRLLVAVLLFILGFCGWAVQRDPLAPVRAAIDAAMPR